MRSFSASIAALLLAGAWVFPACAQTALPGYRGSLAEDRGALGLFRTLRELGTTGRAMHIAAHPDDEDGGAITLLARGQGISVTMCILNRGEAGANLVTGDVFDSLGLLRTQEVLKAADYYGASVRFTRAVDYGYSKNVAETFRQWDRRAVLRDVVRLVRQHRPHVILSRFSGTPRDGHGNHEAAGLLAQEAFQAAGDPAAFPELAAYGLKPWQPLKLYIGNRNPIEGYTLKVNSGELDPLLGRSYAQMARDGLRWQKSQSTGAASPRPGPFATYYHLAESKVGPAPGNDSKEGKESGFFDRIDTTLSGWPDLASAIVEAQAAFRVDRPSASAPALAKAAAIVEKLLQANPGQLELVEKREQLHRALALSLGVQMEARVRPKNPATGPFAAFRPADTFTVAVPGQSFGVQVITDVPSAAAAQLDGVELLAPTGWTTRRQDDGLFTVTVPPAARPTVAYWERYNFRQTSYTLADESLLGQPLPPVPLRALGRFRYAGQIFPVEVPVLVATLDATGSEQLATFAVGPPVSLRLATEAGILPLEKSSYDLDVQVTNHVDGPSAGIVRLLLPPGWRSAQASRPFQFARENETLRLRFSLVAPVAGAQVAGAPAGATDAEIRLVADVASPSPQQVTSSFQKVTFPGLGTAYRSEQARHFVRRVDVKVRPNLRVGYVMGAGDEVPEALRQMGVPVTMLEESFLRTGDLAQFPVILVGIRAYAVRKDLVEANARLLTYAQNGGHLIVQYNTPEFDKNFGPYPYSMGRNPEEVSEENSPVTLLDSAHPLWQAPNKITSADFDGWLEQRGSKFLTTWDPQYTALIETHDTGQAPQKGIWLTAKTGKGRWTYCSLAWYRQLPAGVPGAVRLFANLISQP